MAKAGGLAAAVPDTALSTLTMLSQLFERRAGSSVDSFAGKGVGISATLMSVAQAFSVEKTVNRKVKGDFFVVDQDDSYVALILETPSSVDDNEGVLCQLLVPPEALSCGRLPWMGRRELFMTNFICVIPHHRLAEKALVVPLEALKVVRSKRKNKQVHFARVGYNLEAGVFVNYSEIVFLCLCVQPENPDRTFVQCGWEASSERGGSGTNRVDWGCGRRYHPRCVGTSRKIVESVGHFLCPLCKRKTKPMRKKKGSPTVSECAREMRDDEDETEREISAAGLRLEEEAAAKETLRRIDPKTLMLGFERCQRHPHCSKPNRHPARCKLDRIGETEDARTSPVSMEDPSTVDSKTRTTSTSITKKPHSHKKSPLSSGNRKKPNPTGTLKSAGKAVPAKTKTKKVPGSICTPTSRGMTPSTTQSGSSAVRARGLSMRAMVHKRNMMLRKQRPSKLEPEDLSFESVAKRMTKGTAFAIDGGLYHRAGGLADEDEPLLQRLSQADAMEGEWDGLESIAPTADDLRRPSSSASMGSLGDTEGIAVTPLGMMPNDAMNVSDDHWAGFDHKPDLLNSPVGSLAQTVSQIQFGSEGDLIDDGFAFEELTSSPHTQFKSSPMPELFESELSLGIGQFGSLSSFNGSTRSKKGSKNGHIRSTPRTVAGTKGGRSLVASRAEGQNKEPKRRRLSHEKSQASAARTPSTAPPSRTLFDYAAVDVGDFPLAPMPVFGKPQGSVDAGARPLQFSPMTHPAYEPSGGMDGARRSVSDAHASSFSL